MPDILNLLTGIAAIGIIAVALKLACLDHWSLVATALVLFGVTAGAARPRLRRAC